MLEGWRNSTLSNVVVTKGIQIGPFGSQLKAEEYVEDENGVPVVMPRDIAAGKVHCEQIARVSQEKATKIKKHQLESGDILFPRRGDLSRIGLVTEGQQGWICGTGCLRARLSGVADPSFLIYHLNQRFVIDWLEANAVGQTMLNLNTAILSDLPIILPPLPEQRKISAILRTWDEALEKLTALSAVKESRLTGLRDRLLFGTPRAKKQKSNWPLRRISEVTHEVTDRNSDMSFGRGAVMGVSNKRGIVPMREQTVAGDIVRYKLLPPQAFAYNPMRINVGSIAKNEASETVLVSPDYVVFGCTPDGIEPDYLDHLRKTPWWAHYINSGGSGSVRQRTYYADLAALRLPLPDIEEQREIVAILNAAKADLSSTDEMIEALKLQKRGLMQKLLTGEWRVNLKEVI